MTVANKHYFFLLLVRLDGGDCVPPSLTLVVHCLFRFCTEEEVEGGDEEKKKQMKKKEEEMN
tara:strand:- start:24 stop:209 length:186 start_codon:yes stop_codon:yes gene_type:complete